MTNENLAKALKVLRSFNGAYDEYANEIEHMARDVHQFKSALYWALGEGDDFPGRQHNDGPYWWRTELRMRCGLPINGVHAEPGGSPRDDLAEQIYALLVRRGYAQHEAHLIAGGPGCISDCVQKGYPEIDCPAHGLRTSGEPEPCKDPGWEVRSGRIVCKGCGRSATDVFGQKSGGS